MIRLYLHSINLTFVHEHTVMGSALAGSSLSLMHHSQAIK